MKREESNKTNGSLFEKDMVVLNLRIMIWKRQDMVIYIGSGETKTRVSIGLKDVFGKCKVY